MRDQLADLHTLLLKIGNRVLTGHNPDVGGIASLDAMCGRDHNLGGVDTSSADVEKHVGLQANRNLVGIVRDVRLIATHDAGAYGGGFR